MLNGFLFYSTSLGSKWLQGRQYPLQWRNNDNDSVSNHQPHGCLLNRLFGRRSKKTSKLRVTGLCSGNSPGTGEFPAQMASNAENISMWWRHHVNSKYSLLLPIVVVVFYWPLGSKQISRSIYIHITHTKHGKKLTSAHQSNKEINIASVSVDFVWYMIFFPNMLKQAYKFYSEMRYHITVPLGRACHAATTQPIPIFRLLQQSG